MAHTYLIRYGSMGRVGKFTADSPGYVRGTTVVIRSERGTELGEVLVALPPTGQDVLPTALARVLRAAEAEDLERARIAESCRADRFALCQKVFQDGVWPLELVDVEPLLDDHRTVLHYLGPHRLDTAGVFSAFRSSCGLDVVLEPVGRDVEEEEVEARFDGAGCGHCGSGAGSCGSGGGCGSLEGSGHGGCSDCGVKKLLVASRAGRPG